MSFSFQIHHDLQFDHNEEVLKIADDNTPELFHTPKTKVHFVKCVKDPEKLGGWGVQQVETDWIRAYTLVHDTHFYFKKISSEISLLILM